MRRAWIAVAVVGAALLLLAAAIRGCGADDDTTELPGCPAVVPPAPSSAGAAGTRTRANRAEQRARSEPGAPTATDGIALRSIRILDGAGEPIAGVAVGWGSPPSGHGPTAGDALTGPDGCASSSDASAAWFLDRGGVRVVELRGVRTDVVVEDFPDLRIALVHGTRRTPFRGDAAVSVRIHGPNRASVERPAVRDGDDFVVRSHPIGGSDMFSTSVEVAVGDGMVAVAESVSSIGLAPDAKTVRAEVAVYREADVRIACESSAAGRPTIRTIAPARLVAEFDFERLAGLASLEPLAVPRTWRLRGLPAMPGLRVRLECGAEPAGADGGVATAVLRTDWIPLDQGGTFALSAAAPASGPAEPRGNATAGIRGTIARREPDVSTTCDASIVVLRADGSAARDVLVCASPRSESRTDDQGRTTIRCATGRADFRVVASGMLPILDAAATPAPGEIVLREPPGRPVLVMVTDADDRPLPGARVDAVTESVLTADGRLVAMSWDVRIPEAGVQRVSVRTDAKGCATFARVPPGVVRYTAALGSSAGRVSTDASDVAIRCDPAR